MHRTLLILSASLALVATAPANAVGHHVDVQIVDRTTGETLAPILHDGEWWVAGRPGAKYRVTLVNHDGNRTLNVLSIDGVNAISGDTASWDQTGYVIPARQRIGIDGWRKNLDQVAAFEFASPTDSYAARTGRPANVGVIGVAVFDEKPRIIPLQRGDVVDEMRRAAPALAPAGAQSDAASAKALSSPAEAVGNDAPAPRDRLGTGHGAIERSSIRYVDFQRAQPTPVEIVTIHYDRLENLVAMGVVPSTIAPVAVDPFPGSSRFVPDPPPRR